MKKHLLPFLPIALCAPLFAQSGTVPPGYDTTESSGGIPYSYLVGYYPNMRVQVSNADLTGKGVKTMAEISFRQDASVSSSSGVGRTWSTVTLLMCETTLSSLSTTWTANHLTTPTTVYSAQHSFPDITTQPPGSPNPWDNAGLRFPFTSRFLYSGTNDLLLDMTLLGGSLANAAAWGTNSSGSSPAFTYYLDGRSVITSQQGSLSVYGLTSTCTFDTGNVVSSTLGGGYGYFVAFTENSPSNRFRYWNYRTNMPKSANFIQGLSLGGYTSTTTPGPLPGLGCQAVQVDFSKIFYAQAFTTNSTGTYSQPTQFAPFIASIVGTQIWSQGIWNDTVTNEAKLTRTSRLTVAALPPAADFNGRIAYRYGSPTAPNPTTSFSPSMTLVPLFRYK